MNISKKEQSAIASLYGLGDIISVKLIPYGMISYSFIVGTTKGTFIVRKLGYQLNRYHRGQKKLEFKALEYLWNQDFPYSVPHFIKNKHGNYISRLGNKLFEAYPYLPGEHVKKLSTNQVKEIARAMALYHKCMKNFKFDSRKSHKFGDCHWVFNYYKKLEKVSPKEEVDKLMLKHIGFFENILKEVSAYDFNKNLILVHNDFSKSNVLFLKGKLCSIIDFENLRFGPASSEIAYFLKYNYNNRDLFLREYRKYNSLKKEEENWILPLLLMNNCVAFWWTWAHMDKHRNKRYPGLKMIIKNTRKLYKLWQATKE